MGLSQSAITGQSHCHTLLCPCQQTRVVMFTMQMCHLQLHRRDARHQVSELAFKLSPASSSQRRHQGYIPAGGALAAGALHIFSSHPEDSSRPLLDMNIALLFMPCLLVGVTVGMQISSRCPHQHCILTVQFKELKCMEALQPSDGF